MKKVLVLTVLAMFLMVPVSFAKTAISEGDLAAVTAQEGVTINMDNFFVNDVQVDVQAWGDGDGFGATYTAAGWVGASIATTAGSSGHFIGLTGDLTIDVGTNAGGDTAVKIGLPGISIDGSMTQVLQLAGSTADFNTTAAQTLGTSYMSGITLETEGFLIITAH